MSNLETYSADGPTCPHCKCQLTPDESYFYDENGYTEDECPSCERTFKVEVFLEASWTTTPLDEVQSPACGDEANAVDCQEKR